MTLSFQSSQLSALEFSEIIIILSNCINVMYIFAYSLWLYVLTMAQKFLQIFVFRELVRPLCLHQTFNQYHY